MELRDGESIEASIARLDELDETHLALGQEMLQAFGGAMYGMDLLAVGALNRSKAHIAGFRQLVQGKNMICAGAFAEVSARHGAPISRGVVGYAAPRLCAGGVARRSCAQHEGPFWEEDD